MPEAFVLMNAWGFEYKTLLTWYKLRLVLGYWFRGSCEHLLLGVKGKVSPFKMQVPNIYACRPARHSEKPVYFRKLIDEAVANSFGKPVKLELFARHTADDFDRSASGWDVYGNEVSHCVKLF